MARPCLGEHPYKAHWRFVGPSLGQPFHFVGCQIVVPQDNVSCEMDKTEAPVVPWQVVRGGPLGTAGKPCGYDVVGEKGTLETTMPIFACDEGRRNVAAQGYGAVVDERRVVAQQLVAQHGHLVAGGKATDDDEALAGSTPNDPAGPWMVGQQGP